MDTTTGSDQPVPPRSVVLTILSVIARLSMRLARLPRIEGVRVLMCVPNSEPYLPKLRIAVKLLFDTEADAKARGRDAWFAISIRDLPPKTPFRWTPELRVLDLDATCVQVWSPLMLAGTLAKSSVLHYLILKPPPGSPLALSEINRLADEHANWFFSHFSAEERHAAQESLNASRREVDAAEPKAISPA